MLAALVVMAGERKENAAFALADVLSRRGLERPCELLVAWAREAWTFVRPSGGGSHGRDSAQSGELTVAV
jgi:hypothetical protein